MRTQDNPLEPTPVVSLLLKAIRTAAAVMTALALVAIG